MCENTSISMCDNGGREVKNGLNLCYVIFERSLTSIMIKFVHTKVKNNLRSSEVVTQCFSC